MNEKFTSNNFENDELNLNTEESDYKNLFFQNNIKFDMKKI